jgi:hypothetical protein
LGDDHPDTLKTMNNLAETYRAQGRTADAARIHEEVLEKSRRILGCHNRLQNEFNKR